MIAWRSRKHSNLELSTTEEEYIAVCSASSEVVWLLKMILGFLDLEMDATCIYCENQSCIRLPENPVLHDKSKHIEIKYHCIHDMVEKGAVKLQYVATYE